MNRYFHTALRSAIAIAAIAITASASANTRWNIDEVTQPNTDLPHATIHGWFEVDQWQNVTDWSFQTDDTVNQAEDRFGNYYTRSNSVIEFSGYGDGLKPDNFQLSTQDYIRGAMGSGLVYRSSLLALNVDLPSIGSTTGTTGSGHLFETDWRDFVQGSSNVQTHSGMFTVTAVPEPETLTMGLAGLAALAGAAARRRRAFAKAAS